MDSLATIAEFTSVVMRVINVMLSPRVVWDFVISISYWIVAVSCSVLIIYHAVTQDPTVGRLIGFIVVTYILLKGVDLVI